MGITIQSTVVAIITSSLISSSVSYLVFKKNYMFNELKILNDNYMQIKSFAIQFPYLEDQEFIRMYNDIGTNKDEKYIRYQVYCSFVFNTMQKICMYFNYDIEKIRKFVRIKEIVRQHRLWWENPSGMYKGKDGYEEKFKLLVNDFLKVN